MVTASSPGEPCHDGLISVTQEQMKEELKLAQPPPSAVTSKPIFSDFPEEFSHTMCFARLQKNISKY